MLLCYQLGISEQSRFRLERLGGWPSDRKVELASSSVPPLSDTILFLHYVTFIDSCIVLFFLFFSSDYIALS